MEIQRYLYHKSSISNRPLILENGIMAYRGMQWLSDTDIDAPAVFATNSDNEADWFDSGWCDDVWRIDTHALNDVVWLVDPNFGWSDDYKHVYTLSNIPLDAITLFKVGTGIDLWC